MPLSCRRLVVLCALLVGSVGARGQFTLWPVATVQASSPLGDLTLQGFGTFLGAQVDVEADLDPRWGIHIGLGYYTFGYRGPARGVRVDRLNRPPLADDALSRFAVRAAALPVGFRYTFLHASQGQLSLVASVAPAYLIGVRERLSLDGNTLQVRSRFNQEEIDLEIAYRLGFRAQRALTKSIMLMIQPTARLLQNTWGRMLSPSYIGLGVDLGCGIRL